MIGTTLFSSLLPTVFIAQTASPARIKNKNPIPLPPITIFPQTIKSFSPQSYISASIVFPVIRIGPAFRFRFRFRFDVELRVNFEGD